MAQRSLYDMSLEQGNSPALGVVAVQDVLEHVAQRVHDTLGQHVRGCAAILGGRQNRLYRLTLDDASPLVVKVYQRDRWPRLEHEYAVLRSLANMGVSAVPRPIVADAAHGFAVYSFVAGQPRPADAVGVPEARAIGRLAAALHRAAPADVADVADGVGDMLAADAVLSIDQHLAVIECRASGASADIRAALAELSASATADLSPRAMAATRPRSTWRLTSGDFGVNNLLFEADGSVSVVDFEAGGWDDPAHMVMAFALHGGSEGLSPTAGAAFLDAYTQERALSQLERSRFERMRTLVELEWIAIYASAMSDEAIAGKRFADPDLDVDAYLAGARRMIDVRLARARSGASRRVSAD
jgi:Ser/Thr protein kinase RdoA (MazF antagonist)